MTDKIEISGNWIEPIGGNVNSFDKFELLLYGNSSLSQSSSFTFQAKLPVSNALSQFNFKTQRELIEFCEKIRGERVSHWNRVITEIRGLNTPLQTTAFHRIYQENFLKSLFMTYYWLDLALLENTISIEKMLDDEIIIEYTANEGRKNYLYFLDLNIVESGRYDDELDELLLWNMVLKLDVESKNRNVTNYFVPVFEIGVPGGIISNKTKKLWVKIISDLETSLRYKFGAHG